jgi:hypothetical protein
MKHALWRLYLVACLCLAVGSITFAQVSVPLGGTVNVPAGGSINMGCSALEVQGAFNVNSGQVSNSASVTIGSTGNLNGGSGTLSVSGNWNNTGTFVPGTGSVLFTDGCTAGAIQIAGTNVFNNLTLSSNSGRNFVFPAGSWITVTGKLTLQGSGLPIALFSAGNRTTIVMAPGSQLVSNNVTGYHLDQNGQVIIEPPSIPTLSEYALLLLSLMMALTVVWHNRKNQSR